jgi:hypothetical protein
LRATPTKLVRTPSSPHHRQSPCPFLHCSHIDISADITTAACAATFTAAVLFHFPPRSRIACTCRLQFRHLRLFCLSAAAVRRFPYVIRSVSPPPLVSCSTEPVRAQLPRAAQVGQTQSSLAPRSPLPFCTARTASAAAITAAAWTACTCRLQFRHLFLHCISAAAARHFPYVVRSLSPPLVSCSTEPVRAQLPRAAQDQTRSGLAPRSPLPSALPPAHTPPHTHTLPGREQLLARPPLMRGPPALPPTT